MPAEFTAIFPHTIMNQLEALSRWSTVVADTGDFHQLAQFRPRDATTNPTPILKAAQMPAYRPLIDEVLARHRNSPMDDVTDHLLVRFGTEILSHISGRVSTEVDARLSFDTAATMARAERIVATYRAVGVEPGERLLIKIAATWEGIQAAAALENQGIHCNLTLVFSMCQAVACADAGVTLISPFVGRIHDWHKKNAGVRWNEATYEAHTDPGVQSGRQIFNYYKRHGIATEIMGASFRNVEQIAALAGCDLLTISPVFLNALSQREGTLALALDAKAAQAQDLPALRFDEAGFRYALNADAMAQDSLAEGIRGFAADGFKLETLLGIRAEVPSRTAPPSPLSPMPPRRRPKRDEAGARVTSPVPPDFSKPEVRLRLGQLAPEAVKVLDSREFAREIDGSPATFES